MFDLLIFLVLLFLGSFFGRRVEKSHYNSILQREQALNHIPVTAGKNIPDGFSRSFVASGNVVVSIDYFKLVSATIQNFLGGRVSAYESVLDRARREAVLRMKELAVEHGAEEIINLRIETASLFKGNTQATGCVEVFAYGTALAKQ